MQRRSFLTGTLAAAAAATALPRFATPARAADAPKLTVLLDWFVNPDHAALVIAQAGGHFAKAGVDVTFIEPADPSAPPRLVAAGQGDIALTYQPTFYQEVADGMALVRVGAAIDTPLNTLIALEAGPIRTLADLKGKLIGYSVDGYEQTLLAMFLQSVGLTLDDVKLVNVNFALTEALVAGRVDAVIGGYRNVELIEMRLAGHPGRAFFPEDIGYPSYDELIYVATPDKAKTPAVRAFLDGVEQATNSVLNHPAEAWALFAKAYPKLDDELNRQSFIDTVPRLAHVPAAVDPARYARFGQFMHDKGLIKEVLPVASLRGRGRLRGLRAGRERPGPQPLPRRHVKAARVAPSGAAPPFGGPRHDPRRHHARRPQDHARRDARRHRRPEPSRHDGRRHGGAEPRPARRPEGPHHGGRGAGSVQGSRGAHRPETLRGGAAPAGGGTGARLEQQPERAAPTSAISVSSMPPPRPMNMGGVLGVANSPTGCSSRPTSSATSRASTTPCRPPAPS